MPSHNFSAAVVSNLVFLLPAIAGVLYNQPQLGLLSLGIFISSSLYHIFGHSGVQAEYLHNQVFGSKQFVLQTVDTFFAVVLIIYLIGLFMKQPIDVTSLYDVVILVLLIAAPVFFLCDAVNPYYQLFHSLWHTCGALVLFLIIFR